jgi:hypothetical protein
MEVSKGVELIAITEPIRQVVGLVQARQEA